MSTSNLNSFTSDTGSRRGPDNYRRFTECPLLAQLATCIDEAKAIATFTCGGSLPVSSEEATSTQHEAAPASGCGPVITRWDSTVVGVEEEHRGVSKLILPLGEPVTNHKGATDVSVIEDVERLVHDCQPATFGLGGKDVYDESYRKAIKMDRTTFSVDFCPYESGIIDNITQALLPRVAGEYFRGIKAELYKLNVYSGPSGMFHSHVDTPRSEDQFGSLVICLPCAHEGGALVVRHMGNVSEFDWSGTNPRSISWAAFYSDCEHEVLEVTSGHRITLTYNLYISRSSGLLTGKNNISLNPKQFPLHGIMKNMLEQPSFIREGTLLGIKCAHAYAHTTKAAIRALPHALKGVDMIIYEVCRALGLQVWLRPLVTKDEDECEYERECEDFPEREIPEYNLRKYFFQTLAPFKALNYQFEDGFGEVLDEAELPHDRLIVDWLDQDEVYEEPALAYIAYGNEADMGTAYTSLTLLIHIPPYDERKG